jgi:hypothetical protein
MLGSAATHLPYLKKLDFSRNQLFEENAEDLAKALSLHKQLIWLDLTSINLADRSL